MPTLNQIVTRVQSGKLGGVSYRISLKNQGEKIQINKAANTPIAIQAKAKKVVAGIVSGKIVVPSNSE
jgi:hypothetical protein